jgi:hypothetical protein
LRRSPDPSSSRRKFTALAGLTRVRAQRLQIGREGAIGAEYGFDGHRRSDIRRPQQGLEVAQGEDEHPERSIGPVDEREPLLRGQRERRDPRLSERFAGVRQGRRPRPRRSLAGVAARDGEDVRRRHAAAADRYRRHRRTLPATEPGAVFVREQLTPADPTSARASGAARIPASAHW